MQLSSLGKTNSDLGIGEKALENCKLARQKKPRPMSKKNTPTGPLNYLLPRRMNVSSLILVSAFHLVLTLFFNTSIIFFFKIYNLQSYSVLPSLLGKSLCWSCSRRMTSSKLLISVFVNITYGFMQTDIILQKKPCLSGISEIT